MSRTTERYQTGGTLEPGSELNRFWDREYEKWAGMGFPDNEPKAPIPGEHPQKDHLWNLDKRQFCIKYGIPWLPNGEPV